MAVAVARIVPSRMGTTLIVAVAIPELVIVPKLQTTTLPEMVTKPCDGVASRMPTETGNVLVTVTKDAGEGPRLVTETV